MKTIEQFEVEVAAKRARLEKDLALIKVLPTVGKTVTWTGENGWDEKGQLNPPIEKTIEVCPRLVHSPFRGAEHVAYRVPDSIAGDQGENLSSKYRVEFARRYWRALLDTYEPYLIDIVAIKGRYASLVPESYDWKKTRTTPTRKKSHGGDLSLRCPAILGSTLSMRRT